MKKERHGNKAKSRGNTEEGKSHTEKNAFIRTEEERRETQLKREQTGRHRTTCKCGQQELGRKVSVPKVKKCKKYQA
jgi:hypothetical protein